VGARDGAGAEGCCDGERREGVCFEWSTHASHPPSKSENEAKNPVARLRGSRIVAAIAFVGGPGKGRRESRLLIDLGVVTRVFRPELEIASGDRDRAAPAVEGVEPSSRYLETHGKLPPTCEGPVLLEAPARGSETRAVEGDATRLIGKRRLGIIRRLA